MQILAIATAIAVVCALHPIPNQGARHCGTYSALPLRDLVARRWSCVVTVPTSRGLEDVVLRLLAGAAAAAGEHRPEPAQPGWRCARWCKKPWPGAGVAPTGCGKTTTLHSVVRDINTAGRKIWTAEDPIEITQEGLRQVQVNPRIGWTFAAAMRTFARRPDVIMIGEMRDEETARIAIEARSPGTRCCPPAHQLWRTESIARLLEIGLDPFNFSDSLLAILAQRLVRRLCTACREPRVADDEMLTGLASQYLDSGTHNTAEARQAQIGRWRQQYGGARASCGWRPVAAPNAKATATTAAWASTSR